MSEQKTGRIEIASKRDGFRRGGLVHSRTPTVHDISGFSTEQLAAIRGEPMLSVRELPVIDPQSVSAAPAEPASVGGDAPVVATDATPMPGAARRRR